MYCPVRMRRQFKAHAYIPSFHSPRTYTALALFHYKYACATSTGRMRVFVAIDNLAIRH